MRTFITAPTRWLVGLVLGPPPGAAERRAAAVEGRAARRLTPAALGTGGGR
jgi:hypothetical protein